jgi:hypothetical protein
MTARCFAQKDGAIGPWGTRNDGWLPFSSFVCDPDVSGSWGNRMN